MEMYQKTSTPPSHFMPKYERIRWSPEQLRVLNEEIRRSRFPSGNDVRVIASKIETTERRVRVWFQNQRQRVYHRMDDEVRLLSTVDSLHDDESVSSISMILGIDMDYIRNVLKCG